ncbi:MAG: tetratricopeptide repeat protein [Planctomycetia bacterium]|nr:tetratricopeptide repeat protein [Planctomycetia bacterium]
MITAKPAGPAARTTKWSRRHPAAALAVVVAILLPLLGAGALVWHNRRISQELQNTNAEWERAEANLATALDAVIAPSDSSQRLAPLPQSEEARREMLERALAFGESLLARNPGRPELRLQTARLRRRVADIHQLLGNTAESQRHYDAALAELEALANEPASGAVVQHELAAAANNRGMLHEYAGRREAARGDYETCNRMLDALQSSTDPENEELMEKIAAARTNLGNLAMAAGETIGAEALHGKALRLRQQLRERNKGDWRRACDLAASRNNLGIVLLMQERVEGARDQFRQALDLLVGLPPEVSQRPEVRRAVAAAHNNLGTAEAALKDLPAAESAYGRSAVQIESLVRDFPRTREYRDQLATVKLNLELLMQRRKDASDAQRRLLDTIAAIDALAAQGTTGLAHRQAKADALHSLARQTWTIDGAGANEAEKLLKQAIEIQRSLAAEFPREDQLHAQLADLHRTAAEMLARRKDLAGAQKHLEQAIAAQGAAADAQAGKPEIQTKQRELHVALCENLMAQGEPAAAALVAARMPLEIQGGAEVRVQAAEILARCIPLADLFKGQKVRDLPVEEFCRRVALQLLADAVKYGYTDARYLRDSADFEPLRQQEDFQKVLAAIESP